MNIPIIDDICRRLYHFMAGQPDAQRVLDDLTKDTKADIHEHLLLGDKYSICDDCQFMQNAIEFESEIEFEDEPKYCLDLEKPDALALLRYRSNQEINAEDCFDDEYSGRVGRA